jgi:hypothetical protein
MNDRTQNFKGQVFGEVINKDLLKEEYLRLGKPLGEPNPDNLKRWSHQQIDAIIDGKVSTLRSNVTSDTTFNT